MFWAEYRTYGARWRRSRRSSRISAVARANGSSWMSMTSYGRPRARHSGSGAYTKRAGWRPHVRRPVTGSPGRATRATSAPPSFHRRAVRRSTSAPRARRCRSRSRHASTTALWKIRRTRISLTPRAEYRPQVIVNRSDGLENRHPSPPPGPGRGSRERGVRSEVARLLAGPPHPLAHRRGVHPGRHRRRRRADLHPDPALHGAGEVLPRRGAELLGQGRRTRTS